LRFGAYNGELIINFIPNTYPYYYYWTATHTHHQNTESQSFEGIMILGVPLLIKDLQLNEKVLSKIITDSKCSMPVPLETCRLGQSSNTKISVIVIIVAEPYSKGDSGLILSIGDLNGMVARLLVPQAVRGIFTSSKLAGTVILVLDPQLSYNDKGTLSLSVQKQPQLLCIGTAKYFGICTSNKKDGTKCRMAIDTSLGHVCKYHSTQDSTNDTSTTNLVHQQLGLSNLFYSTNQIKPIQITAHAAGSSRHGIHERPCSSAKKKEVKNISVCPNGEEDDECDDGSSDSELSIGNNSNGISNGNRNSNSNRDDNESRTGITRVNEKRHNLSVTN